MFRRVGITFIPRDESGRGAVTFPGSLLVSRLWPRKRESLRRGPRFQGKGFALNAVSPIFGREDAACNQGIPLRVSPFHARVLAS